MNEEQKEPTEEQKKTRVSVRMEIRDEEHLGREVLRALKFFDRQVKKGWTIEEAVCQVENSYGDRVAYFMLLSIQASLERASAKKSKS